MAIGDVERVWAIVEDLKFCMLATWDGDKAHARPMQAFARPKEDAIYFFTDEESRKDKEIERFSAVCLTFGDPGKQDYLAISGRAIIANDRSKIKELWNVAAKAWWKSPEEPSIRLIKVTPLEAEFWDAPGRLSVQ